MHLATTIPYANLFLVYVFYCLGFIDALYREKGNRWVEKMTRRVYWNATGNGIFFLVDESLWWLDACVDDWGRKKVIEIFGF